MAKEATLLVDAQSETLNAKIFVIVGGLDRSAIKPTFNDGNLASGRGCIDHVTQGPDFGLKSVDATFNIRDFLEKQNVG